MIKMKTKLYKIVESKIFADSIKSIIFVMWLFSGIAGFYIIPGSNLTSQWGYGALFGLGLPTGASYIADKLFWLLYNNISAFRNHVDSHWGTPE